MIVVNFHLPLMCLYGMFADMWQPLPQKHSLKRLDRFNQEFVRTRMVALQNFLQRIANHPVLSFSRHFYSFLTAKQWVRISLNRILFRIANSCD